MSDSKDITFRLQCLHRQLEERDGAIRQKHLSEYVTLMDYYSKVPDSSMSYVFAEFQNGLRGVEIHTDIPHETPEQMRKYMAKVHHCLGDKL
jgi:hypothetical protein